VPKAVNNLSAVGIIFNEDDPWRFFIDMKDGGLPILPFLWTLYLIGGNWIGASAKNDASPLATFRREFVDEFGLRTIDRDWGELAELGLGVVGGDGTEITINDSRNFATLRQALLCSIWSRGHQAAR
jgi:hypothetical protein